MHYPDWWNRTVTLYNKIENLDGSTYWQKTRLDGCFWGVKAERLLSGDNVIASPVYTVRVPPGRLIQAATGDIAVLGDISDDVDEKTQGKRSSDLLRKYGQNAFLIRVFKDNTGVDIPHCYLGG
ncbi:MAG: hypothetical protein LBP79_01255 [Clostridiales bacterium]|jgi:hypothetical protein|nr:hypothetical protein [Clostridiales bacterium]